MLCGDWLLSHPTDKETATGFPISQSTWIRTLSRTSASWFQPVIFWFLLTVEKVTQLYRSNQVIDVYIFIYSYVMIWNFTHKKNNVHTSSSDGLLLWTYALKLFGLIMKQGGEKVYLYWFQCENTACCYCYVWFKEEVSCDVGRRMVILLMIQEDWVDRNFFMSSKTYGWDELDPKEQFIITGRPRKLLGNNLKIFIHRVPLNP